MRVLAIDPALRKTGFAVVERDGRNHLAHTFGVIDNAPRLRPSSCLVNIREQLHAVVRQFSPTCCAVESVIYVQSFKTAITLGAARGAAILAAAEHGMDVFEYPPKRVKQAVVGRGAADKQQVAFMVRALFELKESPPPDAADALAIGLAHLYATDPNKALQSEGSRV